MSDSKANLCSIRNREREIPTSEAFHLLWLHFGRYFSFPESKVCQRYFSCKLFFVLDFIYLFMRDTERKREAEIQAEGEAGSLWGT